MKAFKQQTVNSVNAMRQLVIAEELETIALITYDAGVTVL